MSTCFHTERRFISCTFPAVEKISFEIRPRGVLSYLRSVNRYVCVGGLRTSNPSGKTRAGSVLSRRRHNYKVLNSFRSKSKGGGARRDFKTQLILYTLYIVPMQSSGIYLFRIVRISDALKRRERKPAELRIASPVDRTPNVGFASRLQKKMSDEYGWSYHCITQDKTAALGDTTLGNLCCGPVSNSYVTTGCALQYILFVLKTWSS